MLRPLIIDDAARAKAARVVSYAMDHPYRAGDPVPGGNPNYTAKFGSYRTVFTFTHANDAIYRHLSVSVPSAKFPNPIAVCALADLFGFTGWNGSRMFDIDNPPDGWMIDIHKNEHCVVVVQNTKPIGRGR